MIASPAYAGPGQDGAAGDAGGAGGAAGTSDASAGTSGTGGSGGGGGGSSDAAGGNGGVTAAITGGNGAGIGGGGGGGGSSGSVGGNGGSVDRIELINNSPIQGGDTGAGAGAVGAGVGGGGGGGAAVDSIVGGDGGGVTGNIDIANSSTIRGGSIGNNHIPGAGAGVGGGGGSGSNNGGDGGSVGGNIDVSTNSGTIQGGTSSGGGGAGVGGGGGGRTVGGSVDGNIAISTNSGTIQGGGGNEYGGGGAGVGGGGGYSDSFSAGIGSGVGGNVVVSNSGTIRGGSGGSDGTGNGGDGIGSGGDSGGGLGGAITGSIYLNNTSGSLVQGGDGAGSGAAGVGVRGHDVTIINAGTIAGGLNGNGSRAAAIIFTGGTNRLELQAGWTITGNVVGATGAGTSSTLILGGDTTLTSGDGATAFNVSQIGAFGQYQNFTAFEKTGQSTWTLTGSGNQNWTVTNGGLIVNTTSLTGNVSFTPVSGGTAGVIFDQASNGTYAGTLTGNGSLTKQGTGTLMLSGAQDYSGGTTISAGTLQLGDGTTNGSISGDVSIAAGGTLAFDPATGTTQSFGGVLSGAGKVNQIGAGTTLLTGTSSSVGEVTVSAGTLELGQTGAFNAATYTNNATTTIDGNAQLVVASQYAQASTATLNVSIGANDPAITAGNAVLNGGTLNVTGYTGTQFTVINTTSGITGDFNNVTIGGATSTVDYLTVTGAKSADNLNYIVDSVLTWNAGPTQGSNGVFTLTNATDAFDVSVALTNQAANSTTSWDGQSLTKNGVGTLTLSAMNAYTGPTTINSGTLAITASGGITSDVTNNATFENAGVVTGSVTNATGANFTQTGGSVSGGLTNYGTVNANGGALNGTIANNAGSFNLGGTVTSDRTFGNAAGATLAVSGAGSYTLAGLLTNSGNITVAVGGSLTANTGILNTASGVITNNGTVIDDLDNAGLVTNNLTYNANVASNVRTIINSAGATWNGDFNTAGIVNNDGAINGSLTQTAGTTNNNGSITGAVTVSGGLFTGIGSSGALTVGNGATFKPGSGIAGTNATVNGNLVFQAGSTYLVNIDPATTSLANVNGAATLTGATVNAAYAPGSYVAKQYTILTATGGLGGTTFDGLTATGLPASFLESLSYDGNAAYLNLTLNYALLGGLNVNQQNVANALTNSFNTAGGIPGAFALTPTGLSQVSGELATAPQQAMINAANLFLGLMTGPFASYGPSQPFTANAYAAATSSRPAASDAFAAINKAPPFVFEERWSVWVSGFGGSQSTNGNAVVASHDTTSDIYGAAVGADYWLSPVTRLGFAMAGGATSFRVSDGLGTGRSDLFQVGVYGRHTMGDSYLTGALAYGWQDVTTDRTLAIAGLDRLHADYTTNTFSGRIEAGHRYALDWIGVTPYVAGQFTTFDLPAYSEQALVGSNLFALNYDAKIATASRSELGLRTDESIALANGVLTLRGRLAWAHNFDTDRSIAATFQTLPVASFVVNGAKIGADSALTSVAAELSWRNGWSLAGTFDGEFSDVSTSYAGRGVLRYRW
jgi:uncharacterized protein with beta-barrel porin domain